MGFRIAGIGTSVPQQLITQDDAATLAIELTGQECHGTAIRTLYRRTGVEKRHSVLITTSTNGRPATQSFYSNAINSDDRGPTTGERMRCYERETLSLAIRAARAALRESETAPDEISHLITVSCTGFSAPGVNLGLVDAIGLNRGVSLTNIGFMGCHGALNGMRVAAALGGSLPAQNVLLCCVELCSLHHQYLPDPQQIVANALFSDGAAAIVGAHCESVNVPWRLAGQFSQVLPDTAALMAWRIGDHGFDMRLSPHVPGIIQQMLRPWLSEQLGRYSLRIEEVRSWAIHPGGPRILAACAESLGLGPEYLVPSQSVLADYGNMSSPTVLFILEQLRAQGNTLPCVVMAFGPGLSIEAALFV